MQNIFIIPVTSGPNKSPLYTCDQVKKGFDELNAERSNTLLYTIKKATTDLKYAEMTNECNFPNK